MSPQENLKSSVPSGKSTILIYYIYAISYVFRPACWDVDMLVKMLDAGMNCARLNFSQGDHKGHSQSLDNLREALA
jgi:pyruvate kinase